MKSISISDFLKKYKAGKMVVIDVRSPDEYQYKHIPQSINIPLDNLLSRLDEIPQDRDVSIICQSGMRSSEACHQLDHLGISQLATVEGGLTAFEKAGGPVKKGGQTLPLMRQVQIAAGSLVLTGIILSRLVHPAFLFISLFVGGGLIFAGLSGWCGMAVLLSRMPWNRR